VAITAGTYTFGGGGADYASLVDALLDLGTLTGDLTLVQVGDSVDAFNIGVSISLAGNTLKIEQDAASPHNGSPIAPYTVTVGALGLNQAAGSRGGLWLKNLNIIASPADNGTGLNLGAMNGISIVSFYRMESCLVYCTNVNATAVGSASPTGTGGGAGQFRMQLSACKFYGGKLAYAFSTGSSTISNLIRVYLEAENNFFKVTRNGGTDKPVSLSFLVGSPATPIALFSWKNNVHWVADAAQPGMTIGDSGNNFYAPSLSGAQNARNPGSDSLSWAYDSIQTPDDIITTDSSLAGFGNTDPDSDLYTNGTAPALAFNPFSTPPYLIGLTYPAAPPEDSESWYVPAFVAGF